MFVFSFTRLLSASLVFGTEVWEKYAVVCGISAGVFKFHVCWFCPQTKTIHAHVDCPKGLLVLYFKFAYK